MMPGDGICSVQKLLDGIAMRIIALAATAICITVAPPKVYAAEVIAVSKIETVTVFPSGAQIERTLRVKLAGGDQTVVSNITNVAVVASLRVEAMANGKLEIGSVDSGVVSVSTEDAATNQSARKAIEDEIQTLRDRQTAQDDVINGVKLQQTYLQHLANSALPQENPFPAGHADQDALFHLLGGRMTETAKAITEAKLQQRTLERSIADLQKRLPAPLKSENRTQVRINVKTDTPQEATLILRYQVNAASWTPFYDARLTSNETDKKPLSKLALIRRASITQTTGEDWNDVRLALSSTRPGASKSAPDLNMLSVDFVSEPNMSSASTRKSSDQPRTSYGNTNESVDTRGRSGEAAAAKETPAQTSTTAFQAVYIIPGVVTMPSSGEVKRLLIASEELDAALFIRAVPRLDQTAYVYADFTFPKTTSLLLPGAVSLFRDGVFVGNGTLPELVPGEAYELGLGSDERTSVEQFVLDDKKSETGTFSKSHFEERRYAIVVKNLHERRMKIEVFDRMPVAMHDEIKVDFSVTNGPEPVRKVSDNKRGTFHWDLILEPGAETKISYGYSVTAPADRKIQYRDLNDGQIRSDQFFKFGAATKF